MIEGWIPLIPLHSRILLTLVDQRQRDPHGAIGTKALREDSDRLPLDDALRPLLERRVIEDCSAYRFQGQLFTRITDFGASCLTIGLMPPRPVSGASEAVALNERVQRALAERASAAAR